MPHFRKSYWAPDGQGGYKESTLVDGDIEKEGAKCTVMIGHEVIMSPEKISQNLSNSGIFKKKPLLLTS